MSAAQSSRETSSENPPGNLPLNPWEIVLSCFTSLLFSLRYFQPAEDADSGSSLWIAFSWVCLLTLTTLLITLKKINLSALRWNLWDIAVSLLSVGHILGGLLVLTGNGNRYFAMNLTWEWISLLATWFMLRLVTADKNILQSILKGFTGIVFTLTLLAFYQYFIFYPDLKSQVQPLFQEFEVLSSKTTPAAPEKQRLLELESKFRELGLPEDPKERKILAQRMFFSTEVFGYFGLANTFAGVLVVGLIYCMIIKNSLEKLITPAQKICLTAILLCIFTTLYLTKSRTALVAIIIAISLNLFYFIWLKPASQNLQEKPRTPLLIALLLGLLISVSLIFYSFSQLDQKVITEAPKSLQYRLEYWTSTWQIIKNHPLIGCRLGQFRPAYLEHKLLGSSEEIKDPHQMLLDVWVNGGLRALAGLVLLYFMMLVSFFQIKNLNFNFIPLTSTNKKNATLISLSMGSAFLISYFYHLLIGESLSEFIFLMLIFYAGWHFLTSNIFFLEIRLAIAGLLSLIGLSIHLQGAGGVGMPAIFQLLLLAGCCLSNSHNKITTPLNSQNHNYLHFAALTISLCLTILCHQYALTPYLQGKSNFLLASTTQDSRYREACLQDAIKAAPLNPDYRLAYANWTLEKFKHKQATLEQFFTTLDAAISADPLNPRTHKQAGLWCDQLFRLWKQAAPDSPIITSLIQKTSAYFETTYKLYPYDGQFLAHYAVFLHDSQQSEKCSKISLLALKIHQTNEAHGHVDKILPINTVHQLQSFVK